MTHMMDIPVPLSADGIELCSFFAKLTITRHPACGDGWNEPHEPVSYELHEVMQMDGPFIPSCRPIDWAERWVESHQQEIANDIAWEPEF